MAGTSFVGLLCPAIVPVHCFAPTPLMRSIGTANPVRQRLPSRATAARVGSFSLLTVLVYVADEHPAFQACARALEAGVVYLYGVVVAFAGWVRVGSSRPKGRCQGHSTRPLGAGRGACCPKGRRYPLAHRPGVCCPEAPLGGCECCDRGCAG
jgi:hypothetical protein